MKIWRKRIADLMNESINDEAVYRTAPATPGLLITLKMMQLMTTMWWCEAHLPLVHVVKDGLDLHHLHILQITNIRFFNERNTCFLCILLRLLYTCSFVLTLVYADHFRHYRYDVLLSFFYYSQLLFLLNKKLVWRSLFMLL